jgi:hypothetical protein
MKLQSKSEDRPILIHSQAILNAFPINKGVNYPDLVTKILQPGRRRAGRRTLQKPGPGLFFRAEWHKKRALINTPSG